MGNTNSTKNQKEWMVTKQTSTDVEPTQRTFKSLSPFRRSKSEAPQELPELCDVPGKPGKAIVTLTNLQSDKPSGSCVTDSIYLDWKAPTNDGGRKILGYTVEMYDLPTGNWVTVTQTEGPACRSMLDNILCGIMYRFRVRAFNEVGSSIPGIPSDAFVIDTPGVHIAPYFILCPPPEVSKFSHETVQFRAKALGTPTPNILWQKDDEPIFITQGIDIEDEPDGSLLTVNNLQIEDDGIIECIAVNSVGKAIASTRLLVISPPKFKTSNIPLQFSFRNDDMIRLKFPLMCQPEPQLVLFKNSQPVPDGDDHCLAVLRDSNVLLKIDSAQESDSGLYRIVADNGYGSADLELNIVVEVPPASPSSPEILDMAPTGELTLAWQAPESGEVDHYIVEYFRDQWKLWLRMKTCLDNVTVISDLIPGSKYKFRIMAASASGISEPSQESEEIMIGKPAEDELFDLPRGRNFLKKTRKVPSFDKSSLDRSSRRAYPQQSRRHTSLDREVYYDSNNERRDVVTYKPSRTPELEKIGALNEKYKLSTDDLVKYKRSMSELCNKMKTISNTSVNNTNSGAGSRTSLDTATKPLQMEITNQARMSNSMGQLSKSNSVLVGKLVLQQQQPTDSSRSSQNVANNLSRLSVDTALSNDLSECRQSMQDIRSRIGSLQSLLKTSKTITASKKSLFGDPIPIPQVDITEPENTAAPEENKDETTKEKAEKQEETNQLNVTTPPHLEQKKPTELDKVVAIHGHITHRNDSYTNAVEEDPVMETHFPYNPTEGEETLTRLECDKYPQRKTTSGEAEPRTETSEEKDKVEKMRRKKKPFLPSQSSGESDSMMNQTVSNFFGKTIRENSEEIEFGSPDLSEALLEGSSIKTPQADNLSLASQSTLMADVDLD